MAIAFAHVSVHSRSKGHSAVAGAAYRAGDNLLDLRTGEVHNFKNRHDVVYSSIILPDGANAKFAEREYLWNTVESFEKRKDSQVAKDYILALPKELDLETNIQLARNFAYTHFTSNGLIADVAIHDHGDGNPHAHIYVPTRRVLGNSLDSKKARDLNPAFASGRSGKGFVAEDEQWCEKWREFQNLFFRERDIALDVDENHLIAQRHQGKVRGKEKHYLKLENAERREASVYITINDPSAVINALASKYPTFNDKKIQNFIAKNTDTPEQQAEALAAVMSDPELVFLGYGEDGQRTYTSKMNYLKESEIATNAEALFYQKSDGVNVEYLNKVIAEFNLNNEQADALYHITSGRHLTAIVGRAGTGKSYMMRAANHVFEEMGVRVYGMAISGIAAQNLSESGINANTIAHYRKRIQHDKWILNKNDIVIMDEAGMTGLHDMHDIVRYVKARGAKLILVGDHDQLQPINSAPSFKAIVERIGFIELNKIMRQTNAGDRQATSWLARGEVDKAIAYYQQQNAIYFGQTQADADNQLITDWVKQLQTNALPSQIIVAHTNVHVDSLNLQARDELIKQGKLNNQEQFVYQTTKGEINLSIGDRLLLTRNDKDLGVKNGQLATVQQTVGQILTVKLDKNDKVIKIDTSQYKDFTYGYAATIHKTQGATFDNVFVATQGFGWDRYLSYVALSRHKQQVRIYASEESYQSREQMTKTMSRAPVLDSVLNYPLMYGIRRGFDTDGLVKRFIQKTGELVDNIKDKWRFITDYDAHQQLHKHKEVLQDKKLVNELLDTVEKYHTAKTRFHKEKYAKLIDKSVTTLKSSGHFEQFIKRHKEAGKLIAKLEKEKDLGRER